jgi:hypothetical protein
MMRLQDGVKKYRGFGKRASGKGWVINVSEFLQLTENIEIFLGLPNLPRKWNNGMVASVG